MKALILAAGMGTRLRPLTYTLPKPMLPLANRPILFHILDQIRQAYISQIGIVVSPSTEPSIREAIGDGSAWGAEVTYVNQFPALGLAHAVQVSQEFLKDSPFLMFLGDNLIEEGVSKFVSEFKRSQPDALILLKEVADPRAFGVAELDASGRVIRLVEKPREPKSNLAMVGGYLFTAGIHQAIAQIKPSGRGELEITDAIQQFLDMGKEIRSHVLQSRWLDIGKISDLLEANRFMLDQTMQPANHGQVDDKSQIDGRVAIGEGTVIVESILHGSVSIGKDCRISHSTIGPATSIGQGCTIEAATINNSLILENCTVEASGPLAQSVMGQKCNVSNLRQPEKAIQLLLSNDAEARCI